jgi:hypothetical protein
LKNSTPGITKAVNPAWPKDVLRATYYSRLAAQVDVFQRGSRGAYGIFYSTLLCLVLYVPSASWCQQSTGPGVAPLSQVPVTGGAGTLYLSQFANPALRGALYMTPTFPWTGIYPLYPTGHIDVIRDEGILAGPVRLHPFMGMAEMFTDNVSRTSSKRSDFFTTLAPGIQAQLPIGRHVFVADYRTNIQFYHRTPSNNVQDQTASGLLQFNLASGLKLDLQGEHKLGHDPRGTAVDLLNVEVNKWTTNGFTGRAAYQGGEIGMALTAQTLRWTYLNNNQGIIRDRVSNYTGLRFSGHAFPNTSALLDFSVAQEIYDQNKNLDNAIYTVSTGARWEATGITGGEVLVGYQFIKFTSAQVNQPGPVLSLFRRDEDSAGNVFFAGKVYWMPLSGFTVTVQPYRTIQQTVVAGTSFFTATGVNVSAVRELTQRLDVTANLGYEHDAFSTPAGARAVTPSRSDTIKNVTVGLNYRAVKWVGISLQYVFEDRNSNVDRFHYQANTAMVSVQAFF